MPRDTKTSTEIQRRDGRSSGVIAAFQEVTDGVMDLVKTHLELARAETRSEVKVYSRQIARAAVGVGFALLGFGILNLAVIFIGGWLGGFAAMAIVAAVLGTLYTYAGVRVARLALEEMKDREGLTATKKEIQRSSQWVKEIRETS